MHKIAVAGTLGLVGSVGLLNSFHAKSKDRKDITGFPPVLPREEQV